MNVTELLHRAGAGDREALDQVVPLVYQEMKKIAARHLQREVDRGPLQTTALVHEAYLRLASSPLADCESRAHFLAIASRVMREILVDSARKRQAGKRGAAVISLPDLSQFAISGDRLVLALDDAMETLAQSDALKARIVEMRYFGGMTAEESAAVLSLDVHFVRRQLRLAKAWLQRTLSGNSG